MINVAIVLHVIKVSLKVLESKLFPSLNDTRFFGLVHVLYRI